jgi:hypothetical protein
MPRIAPVTGKSDVPAEHYCAGGGEERRQGGGGGGAENDGSVNWAFMPPMLRHRTAQISARVSGYLVSQTYKEGMRGKAGDLLFEIDSRRIRSPLSSQSSWVEPRSPAGRRMLIATPPRSRPIVRVALEPEGISP